jgi:WD40 repeat protein
LFADHDRRIVGVGTKRSVAMWDTQDGDLIGEFAGTDSDYVDADVSADAALVVTAGEDGVTHLWNADVSAPSGSRFDQGSPVVDVQVDRAGTRLLVRGASGAVRVWNLATRKVSWNRTVGRGDAARIRLTPDGRAVVVLAPASLTVLDAATGRTMRSQTLSGTWSLSPSGRYLVSIENKRVVVLDTLDAGQRSFDAGAAQRAHFGSTDDIVVLEGAVQSKITSPSGTPLATLDGAGTNVGAALSTDGRRLLTFGSRMSPTLWNVAPGRTAALAILYGYGGDVKGAAFSGDGQRVVTIGSDGTARVWSATSGQPLGSFGGEAQRLDAARFSPDGKFIVTISEDGALGVWDDRGTGLLSFPTSSAQAVAPCAVGNLELFAVDGEGVMRYRIDRPPSASSVRALEERLGFVRSVATAR